MQFSRLNLIIRLLACALAFSCAQGATRVLPQLTVKDDVTHPLPLGFSARSVMPWFGPGEAPAFLVANHGAYLKHRSVLYRAAGKDGSGKPFALPADFPVYRGIPFDSEHVGVGGNLPTAAYISTRLDNGLFDLIQPSRGLYYRNIGEAGKPAFAEPYTIKMADPAKEGSYWVADLDGDGVVDLLVGGIAAKGETFDQYPDAKTERGPWSGSEHPNMGPLPDTDIQSFRGYDIEGNWMGLPVRKYLWWAKGALDKDGKLSFGNYKPVRYGQTDYKVQWHGFGGNLSPVVMDLEDGQFIIVFSGTDKVLALPLRGAGADGELRVGKAVPLLKNGARTLQSVNLPMVIGTGDFNGDGFDEIVLGSGANGRLTLLSGRKSGEFTEEGNVFEIGGPVAGDTLTVPARADWDGDGYPDLVLGDASGFYSLWRGTADPTVYQSCDFFKTQDGVIRHRPTDGNMQGEVEAAWSYTQPTIFDWDGDGKPDLISNDNTAKLVFYRNTGEPMLLEKPQRFMWGDKPLPVAWRTRVGVVPASYNLADSARNCLLFMTWDRKMAYAVPEKNGSLNMETVVELCYEDGSPIILSGPVGLGGRVKFSVADWDGDGKWDVVFGVQQALHKYFRVPGTESRTAAPFWLRNVGTNEKPVFEPARQITFKDGSNIDVKKHDFSVFPTDLDGDGKLDIIFGEDEGFIFYLNRSELAWKESVDTFKKARAEIAKAEEQMANLKTGTLATENFDYEAGPLARVSRDGGGQGWRGGWRVDGPQADAVTHPISREGIFKDISRGPYARLSGKGARTVHIRRDFEKPFNLAQQQRRTLVFSVVFSRSDSSNNAGNEELALLQLCDAAGEPLLKVGFDAQERLELRVGQAVFRSEKAAMDFNGQGALRVEIDLAPAGELTKMRAKYFPDTFAEPIARWDMEVSGRAEGLVHSMSLSAGKFAGEILIDSLDMRVQ